MTRHTSYVALLRGINVGGHKKVPMEGLRKLVSELGHTEVATYIQSGNVVFKSSIDDPAKLERQMEARIERELGHDVSVLIRTRSQLGEVLAHNPFLARGEDPARLHVTFLSSEPDPAQAGAIETGDVSPDEFRVAGRHVYLYTPNGMGRTNLSPARWEKKLRIRTTTRNWNTVSKLHQMAGG